MPVVIEDGLCELATRYVLIRRIGSNAKHVQLLLRNIICILSSTIWNLSLGKGTAFSTQVTRHKIHITVLRITPLH